MSDIKEHLHKRRSTLSASSLTTYTSILKNLYKNVFGGDIHMDKFNDVETIMKHLKDVPPNKRKTTLSALVVMTDNPHYREKMLSDVRDYSKEIQQQTKSPEQKENWVEGNEIETVFTALKKDATLLLKKKKALTIKDFQEVQNWVIVALLGGLFIPPRRSKDYCDFKIKNIDEAKDNYYKNKMLCFNSYKTSKYYGKQEVECPAPLRSILNAWIKVNPSEYLLVDTNGNHLTPVKLNQRLNAIFGGRKIAVNALRHSYLTDKYAEHSKVENQLAEDMKEMGSSTKQAKVYIKTDG